MVYILTALFIILDMVTGLVKAIKKKEFNSSVMREGMLHKCGSILCVALGVLTEQAQYYMDIGISIPLSVPICVYIVLMEIGSIIENICLINPEILPPKLKQYFKKLSE